MKAYRLLYPVKLMARVLKCLVADIISGSAEGSHEERLGIQC